MVYLIPKFTIIPIINLWVKKVSGGENLPKEGAAIFAANHASYADHLIIGAYVAKKVNRQVHFLAKKEHFDNFFKKSWHEYVGSIQLDREKKGKEALKLALKALKKGKIIGIHPEGTRSMTGKLLQGKTGVARLALKAKVPVVPIGLIGTFEMLPKGKYIPKLKRATMNIGKPMYLEKYYNKKINKRMLREVTTIIMKEIAKLSNQEYNF